ncbi:outer membrane beta-barrel protein [Vibrio campbellii]|uniref:outer membrane beta-barrel protein n=1 Tax=Vibrio campbellii TaxID=680 RepID=UPI0009A51DA2|nr:autotransporter domain-containing protein [Vibrio campbellii]OPH53846.1 autotransporter [Vibrio campbellii]
MLKDLFGLFILVLLVSAPVFAKEQDPFVAGGVTFMDDHEVLSVEIGAEVLPNLNWSIGFNAPLDSGEKEENGIYSAEKQVWGLHTALGYEIRLSDMLAITPRVGVNYNDVEIEYFNEETSEHVESINQNNITPTLGVKVDIARVGLIVEGYKIDEDLSLSEEEETAIRVMAAYNF